jgi:TnpA family transposase
MAFMEAAELTLTLAGIKKVRKTKFSFSYLNSDNLRIIIMKGLFVIHVKGSVVKIIWKPAFQRQ